MMTEVILWVMYIIRVGSVFMHLRSDLMRVILRVIVGVILCSLLSKLLGVMLDYYV